MNVHQQIKGSILFDRKERAGVHKFIQEKDTMLGASLLKQVKHKRNIALGLTPVVIYLAIRNFERWTAIQPLEWNGFRFFAFVFTALACILWSIHLITQYRRVALLKALIKSEHS